MGQLRFGVACIGVGVLVWVFVPSEFGGLIGVVTLLIAGLALVLTSRSDRGHHDSAFDAAGFRPETQSGIEPGTNSSESGEHGTSQDDLGDIGPNSAEPRH